MRARNVTMDMTLQVKSRNVDGSLDKTANKLLEKHFEDWGRKRNKYVTIDGETSWSEARELFDRTWAIDGECFVRIIKGADNPYMFTLEFLDSLDCDVNYNLPLTASGNKIVMGIELDAQNRPVKYYFKHPDDQYFHIKKHIEIPADEIIHGYEKFFVGQVRGIPHASAAILDINMLSGYKETSLVGARVAAAQMGVWEKSGPGGNIVAKGGGSSNNELPDQEIKPGKILIGAKGWTFKPFTPTQPVANFAAFLKSIMRSIANGLGISYNDFANDLEGVNFSSLRGGTIAERDGWKLDQKFVIDTFCEPVYAAWLMMFLLSGLSILPVTKYKKFLSDKWNGRRWPWVSPKDDAVAKEKELAMKINSPQRICAEMGIDIEDIAEDWKEFNNLFAPLGLTVTTNNNNNNQENNNETSDEDSFNKTTD